ncbi:MAG: hypothetical protein ABI068_03510 [Ktedonobacterales bacterium]
MRQSLQRFRVRLAAGITVVVVVAIIAVLGALYTIDASSSTASFTIHEVLVGRPTPLSAKPAA